MSAHFFHYQNQKSSIHVRFCLFYYFSDFPQVSHALKVNKKYEKNEMQDYLIKLNFSRSPLSGVDGQERKTERTLYYPPDPSVLPLTRRQKVTSCLSHNALTLLTVMGVIGGVVLGIVLRVSRDQWSQREQMYVNYIGELFLRMLKGLILPLIMSSLISAIGSLDLSLSGKIGSRAVTYYFVTTISAVILGK